MNKQLEQDLLQSVENAWDNYKQYVDTHGSVCSDANNFGEAAQRINEGLWDIMDVMDER